MSNAGNTHNGTAITSSAPSSREYDDKVEHTSQASSASVRSRENGAIRDGNSSEKGVHVTKDDDIRRHVEEGGGGHEGEGNAMERVVSKQKSVRDAGSIPNGGVVAWLQVLGAFFLFFNSWGVINTFGSYQTYYETNLLTSSTPSAISWIGSIQAFLLMIVGALSGPVYDAGYFRTLLISGTFFLVLGQMMLSLAKNYWQVLLSQAICVGIGCGFLFVPSVAILSTYFTTRIATAVGLAASGSSLGGVIYPIVFHKLLPQIGFAWTTRTIGFLILGTQLIPNLCMRVRVLPPTKRSLLDLRAFLIPAYSLDVFGFFIGFMGLYMPFFYSQVYALQRNITNEDLAFYLLAVMNSTSVFGRIIPNYIADRLGPFNVVIPCTLISGILCFCFIATSTSAGIIVLIAFYGFFSGTFVSLPPTIIMHLSLDAREKIGTRLGQSFAVIAVGLLIGTPIGGAILARSGFDMIWVYGGIMLVVSAGFLVAARGCHKGWGLMTKA